MEGCSTTLQNGIILPIFFYICFTFYVQKNVKDVMDSNGVRILVDLLTLAHLHTSRATVPLQVKTQILWVVEVRLG